MAHQPGNFDTSPVGQPKQRMGLIEAVAYGIKKNSSAIKETYKAGRKGHVLKSNVPNQAPYSQDEHDTDLSQPRIARVPVQNQLPPPPPMSSFPPQLQLTFESNTPLGNGNYTRNPPTSMPRNERAYTVPVSTSESAVERNLFLNSRSLDSLSNRASTPFNESSGKGHMKQPAAELLLRIENTLLKAGQNFGELKRQDGENVLNAVERFLEQYRNLANAYSDTHLKYCETHASLTEYKTRQNTFQIMENELEACQQLLKARDEELSRVERELASKKLDFFKAQTMLGEQNAKYQTDMNRLASQLQTRQHEHANERSATQQRFQRETERLQAWCDEQTRNARNQENQRHERETSALKQDLKVEHKKWKAYLKQVEDHYEARIKDAEATFEQREKQLNDDFDYQMRLAQDEKEKLCAEFEARITQIKIDAEEEKHQLSERLLAEQDRLEEEQQRRRRELEKQEAALKQRHIHETKHLRSTMEELKKGLYERKHFKGFRDRDLAGRFATIVGQVQDFANIEWDSRKMLSWPFAEHQLLEIHKSNIRKLKKQIIQNSLWVLLYQFVFGSPFRVLGEEARDLDSAWIQIHTPNASSLEWPELTADIEKHRYETAQSFLAVMDPSIRATGELSGLKVSYEDSVSGIVDTLCRALEAVATLEARHTRILESLVRLCAKTWIEFCSQPYRLLVALPEGSGDLLLSPRAKEKNLTLVISPELKRYGDSQGENLGRGEIIPDCQAVVQSYPGR